MNQPPPLRRIDTLTTKSQG
jgi:hypothetical protein